MKLSEVKVTNAKVVRDGAFEVLGKCKDRPPLPFLTYLEDERFVEIINKNEMITCVITKKEFINIITRKNVGIIISKYPKYCFFLLHNNLIQNKIEKKIEIGEGCAISSNVNFNAEYIKIGNNVIIEDNVSINGATIIEDNAIIRA